jgi:RNA-binding protein
MSTLKGFQKKYLRGLAHHLNPLVIIGKAGLGESVLSSLDKALDNHELIKVKFNDFKDRKKEISQEIEEKTESEVVGAIGHVVMFYRQQPKEDKRKIRLPEK